MKFKDIQLKKELLDVLEDMGFEEPTSIQAKAIPPALEGRDVIGQAQTGTGKTAAFGLPMLNKLEKNAGIQGLVIAPTRELAIQVQAELFRLSRDLRAKVFVVYGGAPIGKQINLIQRNKPDVIVGTPGRLLDLIRRKVLRLDSLQTLVLDEADEMLNMGFIEDIRSIIEATPDSRQTLMFSATMPDSVKALSRQFLKNPLTVKVEAGQVTADLIEQYFVKCQDNEKFDILTRLLEVQQPKQAIVFCRTKRRVDEVGRGLSLRGFDAEMIHGDITQQKRTQVIHDFRKGHIEVLVATDVAARGLDISGITHVYNYDITQDPESYVHRIGRTGRAGSNGESITFVLPNEMAYLRSIEAMTRTQMSPLRPPTDQEAKHGQIELLIDRINEQTQHKDLHSYRNIAKMLLDRYPANDLVAALLAESITDSTDIEVNISSQRPLPSRKEGRRKENSQGSRRRRRNRRQGQGQPSKRERRGRRGDRKQASSSGPKKAKRKFKQDFIIRNK